MARSSISAWRAAMRRAGPRSRRAIASNQGGFSPFDVSAGIKVSGMLGIDVRNNNIHDNLANGLWTDSCGINGIYENNRIINNYGNGILHEVSHTLIIRNNIITGNGFGD